MNKFILSLVVALGILGASTATFAQAGSLDPTFGNGGIVETSPLSQFAGAALATDGDIVVAGAAGSSAAIVRYLPNGALDPSFGTNGIVTLPPPSNFSLGISFPLGLGVQSNGKVVVTFYAFNNTGTASEALLLRLNANGQFDPTFGIGGRVNLNFPVPPSWSATATRVLPQPDGKILVTGNITPPFRNHSAPLTLLARYLSNGALDASFGTNGVSELVTPVDLPSSLALLSGDGILAVNAQAPIAAAQFTSAGALVTPPTGGTIIATDNAGITAFQPNCEYLLAETTSGPDGRLNVDAEVMRFELNGTIDSAFQSPVIRFGPDGADVKNLPAGITVDSVGRVVVGAEYEGTSSFASGVARLNANGTPDATFGTDGISTTVPRFVIFGILVQPDNKVIMVGGTGDLARYLAQ
jgi:uncharacterized delta-60 repeat protein